MKDIKKIYCDFDGTITKKDAVNTFFEMYAPKEWLDYEKLWIEGKISSMENAIAQVSLLPPLSKEKVEEYINSIEIDDYFLEFVKLLSRENIELIILSDGFDLFIEKTLEKYGIKDIKIFANHLIHKEDGTFTIEFPYHNTKCDKKAGMCKCDKIAEQKFCYIGDGTSDLCVAKKAKFLFATKSLCKYCVKNTIKHNKFETFQDIINILENEGVFNGSIVRK